MHRITVRRRKANSERSTSDFVVQADTASKLDRQLRDFLRLTQLLAGQGADGVDARDRRLKGGR